MTTSELLPAFEAVLFAGGEPLSIDRFAQVFSVTPEDVVAVMEKLQKKLLEKYLVEFINCMLNQH